MGYIDQVKMRVLGGMLLPGRLDSLLSRKRKRNESEEKDEMPSLGAEIPGKT